MRRDARAYLWDIQQAADAIMRFLDGFDPTTFAENELVYSAVERKFEIIGEALGQLAKVDPDLALRVPDMRDIIAFRNVLIHGYAGIEHRRVWDIAQSALPGLRTVVAELLGDLGR
ncbi:hypothetical protein H261_12014 [Paramagnetospirillum caucaseum]|uniref:Nucleotidyltransferase n=1 Tax=Paramagnetospirillum caucaseum TaxID=1244869 RepID=M3AB74_9PROT|nr:HepT-like ribonuclease domain-containing protein [Paramagnetospirillum caucaseum]EME69759.1 hypothetical protein H261_12014 [Paramagnetospirillum caucaseum]